MVKNFFKKNNLELNTVLTTSTVPTAVNLAKSGMGATFYSRKFNWQLHS